MIKNVKWVRDVYGWCGNFLKDNSAYIMGKVCKRGGVVLLSVDSGFAERCKGLCTCSFGLLEGNGRLG